MRALVRLAQGDAPDCVRCAGGEVALRKTLGCDGPVSLHYEKPPRAPVFRISCACGGRDPACDCRRGELAMYHCPRRLVEGRADVVRAFQLCQHYPLLPAAGGIAEQSSTFVDALAVYHAEEAAVRRMRAEEAERERKKRDEVARRGR